MKRIIALAIAVWVGSSTDVPALEQEAKAIYTGGDIITMNDSQPTAEAIAVKEGKILAVGAKADVLRYKGTTRKSTGSTQRRSCRPIQHSYQ